MSDTAERPPSCPWCGGTGKARTRRDLGVKCNNSWHPEHPEHALVDGARTVSWPTEPAPISWKWS